MSFIISASVLLLVAGSIVRASPLSFNASSVLDAPTSLSSPSRSFSDVFSGPDISTTVLIPTTSNDFFMFPTITESGVSHTASAAVHTKDTMTAGLSAIPTATGSAGSTFTVPISTPAKSAKTSAAVHASVSTAMVASSNVVPMTITSGGNSAVAFATGIPSDTVAAAAAVTATRVAGSDSDDGTQRGSGSTLDSSSGSQCTAANDGAVVCSPDGTMFGLCNGGTAVMQRVSAGTACQNGTINYIADVLELALGQVQSFLTTSDNASSVFSASDPTAVDAKDCPSALEYMQNAVDAANSPTDDSSTGLRFVKIANGTTMVDNSDVQLVLKPDGTAGFQIKFQCKGNAPPAGSSNSKRQFWALWWLL